MTKRSWMTSLLVLLSCRTESASNLATSAITASVSALAQGDGSTNVSASFRDGSLSLTFLQLTADDALSATTGSTTKTMTETSLLGVVTYSAAMPIDAEGTAFTVALTRKKDSGAPKSVVTLPATFTLSALGATSFSRAGGGPTVSWSNAATQPMLLTFSGSCIDDFSGSSAASSTQYSVPAGALKKRTPAASVDGGQSVPDTCEVTLQVDRVLSGTLDPGYAGGAANGIQRRTVTFQTTP